MTLQQALAAAAALGLERLDAQLLLLHALGKPPTERAWLLAHDDDLLPDTTQQAFVAQAARRALGEPLAYLVGHKEFFGLDLQVDPRVLVPRPDTETLVQWALDVLVDQPAPSVLDLGTGSGAVALALQHQRPDASVTATDASDAALAVAQDNAARLQLPVRFVQAHWLNGMVGRFDLIASNPPYVAEGDPHLVALTHEPQQALTAGPDGLADIRRIVQQAPAYLKAGGWLLLEHGHDQPSAVCHLLAAAGFSAIGSRHDIAGIARCSGGRMPDA